MATVTFSNGATVDFNGTPTPADINTVAQSPGVINYQKPSLGSKVLSTIEDIANTVEKPWVSLAAIPLQTGIAAYNKLTGSRVQDPFANYNATFGGKTENIPGVTTGQDLYRKLGDAGQVATQIAAITPGGLGFAAARPIIGNAAFGAAGGLTASMSAGNTDLGQLTKDTLSGAVWGTALGVLQKGLQGGRGLIQGNTGVSPQMATEITTTNPSLITKYVQTTVDHGSDIKIPSPDHLADQALEQRVNIFAKQVLPKAGQAVGDARKAAGNLPVTAVMENDGTRLAGPEAVHHVADTINDVMQEMTGHQFQAYATGETGGLQILNYKGAPAGGIMSPEGAQVVKIPGRVVNLSASETKDLELIASELNKLAENPTIGTASDVLINLDNAVGKWNKALLGENAGNSPVEGVLKFARGAINRIIAPSSPELAKANAVYSGLKDMQAELGTAAGKNVQAGSLLMRRVFSGDKGGDAVDILQKLTNLTQPFMPNGDTSTLLQHAVLAEFAKKNFGDYSTRTLMGQRIAEASGYFGYPRKIVQNILKEGADIMTPNAEKYALSLAKGNDISFFPGAHFIDDFVDSAKAQPALKEIAKGLEQSGFTSGNIMKAAGNVLRLMLLNRLTQPGVTPPPQNTFPQSTPMLTPQPSEPTTQAVPTPLSSGVSDTNAQAINSLSFPKSGQAMSRTLGQPGTGNKLSLSSSLS